MGLPARVGVLEGELVDAMRDCAWCGERHPVIGGVLVHCCGDEHDPDICCQCGHFHDGTVCRVAPCGDYRCCVN